VTEYTIEYKVIECGSEEISPQTRAYFEAALEKSFRETLTGGREPNKPTALCFRNGRFETVELDNAGNIVEPPARCPYCGPVITCGRHGT
jgi:hypothetical protein